VRIMATADIHGVLVGYEWLIEVAIDAPCSNIK
jgi:hypothetical protein